jgi:hypothetical protein
MSVDELAFQLLELHGNLSRATDERVREAIRARIADVKEALESMEGAAPAAADIF